MFPSEKLLALAPYLVVKVIFHVHTTILIKKSSTACEAPHPPDKANVFNFSIFLIFLL